MQIIEVIELSSQLGPWILLIPACSVFARHAASFTQQERRLTNNCWLLWSVCMNWVGHIRQSWPKMSEKIMDLSLRLSLIFQKPLQLRRGFEGARATIEICQLAAADSVAGTTSTDTFGSCVVHKTKQVQQAVDPDPTGAKPMFILIKLRASRRAVHWKEM